jgi:hypothetical protein
MFLSLLLAPRPGLVFVFCASLSLCRTNCRINKTILNVFLIENLNVFQSNKAEKSGGGKRILRYRFFHFSSIFFGEEKREGEKKNPKRRKIFLFSMLKEHEVEMEARRELKSLI